MESHEEWHFDLEIERGVGDGNMIMGVCVFHSSNPV